MVVAYVVVVVLVSFALTVGALVGGFLASALLFWVGRKARPFVTGVVGGAAGVACAVAFGWGVFRVVVGPDSFSSGPFLASTVPLLIPLWNDLGRAHQVRAAAEPVVDVVGGAVADEVLAGAARLRFAVLGYVVGLALAVVWFMERSG